MKTAVSVATVYGAGVVWAYRQTGRYGALRRPARAFLAVGWPGIVAGVGLAYLIHTVREAL